MLSWSDARWVSLSGIAVQEARAGPQGVGVGLAGLLPVNNGPELLHPLLLAPDAESGAHPAVLVDGHTEEREESLPDVSDVGCAARALGGQRRAVKAGRP